MREGLAHRLRWVGGEQVPERAQLVQLGTRERAPFYAVAGRYLPADRDAVIVDVGAGHGGFVSQLDVARRYPHCYLLDGSSDSVARLAQLGGRALLYRAPDPLPFPDASVDFIHCSHLVEHLHPEALHALMREWDRLLRPRGVLVISAPLLWADFYGDLTHVRPYGPEVFVKYLGGTEGARSRDPISTAYQVVETVYRYDVRPVLQGVRSTRAWLDWPVLALAKVCWAVGLRRFVPSGFTLVLRKRAAGGANVSAGPVGS